MNNSRLVVGITQGDSNGIGYEVIIKALADPRILDMLTPVVYGSSKIFGFYRKTVHEVEQMDTNVITAARDAHPKRVNILNCLPDNVFAEPGGATADAVAPAPQAHRRLLLQHHAVGKHPGQAHLGEGVQHRGKHCAEKNPKSHSHSLFCHSRAVGSVFSTLPAYVLTAMLTESACMPARGMLTYVRCE